VLFDVAYADGRLSSEEHEEIRRIAARHVLAHCEANDITGSGNIVQEPNDVLRRHPPAWHMGMAYRFILARRCYNTTHCHQHGSSDTLSCILRSPLALGLRAGM
jgi:hypothetical protein